MRNNTLSIQISAANRTSGDDGLYLCCPIWWPTCGHQALEMWLKNQELRFKFDFNLNSSIPLLTTIIDSEDLEDLVVFFKMCFLSSSVL